MINRECRKLAEWTKILRMDGMSTDAGRAAESVEEHEHFTRHLNAAGLVTGPYQSDWAKLDAAPAPRASPGFATTFWSNKVHRGPATQPQPAAPSASAFEALLARVEAIERRLARGE